MSPPGKKSGLTTKESVVKAKRVPFTLMIAWSSSLDKTGFANAGRKTERIRSALRRPPLPWPRTIVSFTGCGAGQLSCASELGFSDMLCRFSNLVLGSQFSVLSSQKKQKLPAQESTEN